MRKIDVYMANEFNYLSEPNDKCKWTLGKSFVPRMDPDRIHPRVTRQKASVIELEDEVIKHSTKSIELSLDLVQKWCEFMDETWERNKFLASKSAIKLMKYGGLFDLREKFGNSIISKSTKDSFENKLSDHEVSVEDVLDLKSIQPTREHHLRCVIGDWSCRPSQVIITDIDKSFLDPDHTMGDGWDGIDVDAYFGSTPNARRSREAKMQKICIERSVKNNAEELVIKEHLSKIKINPATSGNRKSYLCKCDFTPLFSKKADANEKYWHLIATNQFELSPALIIQMPHSFVVSLGSRRVWCSCSLPSDFKKSMKREVQMYRNSEMISLSLYSWPGNSPPLYQFTMKDGGNGKWHLYCFWSL